MGVTHVPAALGGIAARIARALRDDASELTSPQLSRAIDLARITLMVGLVFLHYQAYPESTVSPFDGMDPRRLQLATFVNSFVLFFFFSVVPLLSLVSGWLFFSFDSRWAAPALRHRIRGRVQTLYLPLVFWNGLLLSALALVYVLSPEHPLLQQVNLQFDGASVADMVNAVFAVTAHPVAFQFWFVRDLFVAVLLSPLLWQLMRRAPWLGAAGLGIAWLLGSDLLVFFRADIVLFFYLGGVLRVHRIRLEIGRNPAVLLMAAYVVLVAFRAAAPLLFDVGDHRPILLTAATRLLRLLGVVACWGVLLQLAPTRVAGKLAGLAGMAFFLYATHFPLIAQVKLLLWQWVPETSDAWLIAHYVASVTLTTALSLALGMALAHLVPQAFALATGGRHRPAGGAIVRVERRRRPRLTS